MIWCLILAIVLFALSGLVALPLASTARGGERLSLTLVGGGAVCGLLAAGATLASGTSSHIDAPWLLEGAAFSLTLDPLAAVFLLPTCIVVPLASLYGLGYWPHAAKPRSGAKLRCFFGLISAALCLVLTSANSYLFLVAWEIMALCGYFLVTTESDREETRRAGYLYLTMTHTGTLALFAMFILLAGHSGSFAFPAVASLAAPGAAGIFLLALFGFGIKAGLLPLHVWLPGAHAAAPSHISALLSGVMIKTGIYGLMRVTAFFTDLPLWWGWTVLLLGALSGILGVVLALAQHDLKRLLAYHSVENIGIICLGLGLALLGRASGQPELVLLGMAGALLHVVNHGLFKSLLFLGAGAVIHATGTRLIDRCGGLWRRMPVTGLCFLGGAVAICGLPPLNGFVSEWFIYLGLVRSLDGSDLTTRLAVLAAPCLALIGGLALACFVKVFGIVFLGAPRSPQATAGHEAPLSMRLPQLALLALCLLIGMAPLLAAPDLGQAAAVWLGTPLPQLAPQLAPLDKLSLLALLFGLLCLGLFGWQRRLTPRDVPRTATWGCGYTLPSARMQYTAASFAGLLTDLFAWALQRDTHSAATRELFPPPATQSSHTPDLCLDRGILPLLRWGSHGCLRLRSIIQNGLIGWYLLYIAVTLVALLVLATWLGGAP